MSVALMCIYVVVISPSLVFDSLVLALLPFAPFTHCYMPQVTSSSSSCLYIISSS